MTSAVPEVLVELLSLAVYTILAGLLTVGGILAENASLQHLGGGDLFLAAWFGAIGVVMLYAGVYGIGYERLLVKASETLAS
ncbi:hypothetical protein [Halovivax limisalsi]|uniref:hypothetical protein n=1 Tax=Halovivax limisalsi TaxID=1453760 RepID=UPI001FFC444D|nr:hypothetical protein [Halovivax limisalsi]